MALKNKKELGQHWLKDRDMLEAIAEEAVITHSDTVLEIGPGLGTLTGVLLSRAKQVIAVEYDKQLADKLPGQYPGKNLRVANQDILQFDFNTLPQNYKVVANVPYYITNKIVQALIQADNKPSEIVLLVQKEVAERIAAGPGAMSMLALATQVYATASLGVEVPREYFTPPPKVDSQVIVLTMLDTPKVDASEQKQFFRVAKAGFSAKRKKLRSSLSGGLMIPKSDVETVLEKAGVSPDARAEDVSIEQWLTISRLITVV